MDESLEEKTRIEFPMPLYYKEVTDILFPYIQKKLNCEVRFIKETHRRIGSMLDIEDIPQYEFVSSRLQGAVHFKAVNSAHFRCEYETREPHLITAIQFDRIPGYDTVQEYGEEHIKSWDLTKQAVLDYFEHRTDLD
ncbi:hypothetical protein KY325_02895 [Candidatus Woesearchaeota archaeon]|nr:hypothetical protein [Candidatus Woesearchaeota archaeon]